MIKLILVRYADEKAKKRYIQRYKEVYRDWWTRDEDYRAIFGSLVELRHTLKDLFEVPAWQLSAWEEEIERREGAVDD